MSDRVKKALYYASWSIIIGFLFILGTGSSHSIWGGILVLVLLAAVYGINVPGE